MSDAFAPSKASTVEIVVAATTARVQVLPTGTTGTFQCRVHNAGTATGYITFGDSTVTATIPSGSTAGSLSIASGSVEVMTVTGTHVAAIAAGATGSLYFTPGSGI